MKIILKVLLIVFVSYNIFAQELYFCESYTEDGVPVGPLNSLEIKPYGTAIYVLIENSKEFNDPILYLFIDKYIDGKLSAFDSKTINIEKNDTWAVTSFEFKEEGTYEAYFLNSSHTRLASSKIEVHFSKDFSSNPNSSSYISHSSGDCEFTFCEMVINGKPINAFNILSLAHTDGQAFFFLNNHVPFGIEKITIQVWKRSEQDNNYEKLIDSKKYKILPEWNNAYIKYIFTSPGKYKIDIFDIDNNFISSNSLEVTN